MKIKKIEIKPEQHVWVDTDAQIKEGDYYYVDNSLGKRIENILPYPSGFVAKIEAASPELNLEGVPAFNVWLLLENEQTTEKELLIPFPSDKHGDFRDGKEIKSWMNGWEQGYKEAYQDILHKIKRGNK